MSVPVERRQIASQATNMQAAVVPSASQAIGRRNLDSHVHQTHTDVAYAASGSGINLRNNQIHISHRPINVTGQPEIAESAVRGSESDLQLSTRIVRLQQILLLPAFDTFDTTTIGSNFRASHVPLEFLAWCLQEEQTQWLSNAVGAGGDLVDILVTLCGRTAASTESLLATHLLTLLSDRYQSQRSLQRSVVIETSASTSWAVHDDRVLDTGTSQELCSSQEDVDSLNSMMTCGHISGVSESPRETIEHIQESYRTALGMDDSAWQDDVVEQCGSQFSDAGY